MNKEFFAALDLLEKEKGIPKDYMMKKIETALVSAYKKEYGNDSVRIAIDPEKEDVRVFQCKTVVDEVTDPATQISLEDARAINKRHTVGKVIETEVKTKNFRRLSAAAAKSVIIQGIREGERQAMCAAYDSKREEIITATVVKVDKRSGVVMLDTGMNDYAALPRSEQVPGEELNVGDKIKVYIADVNVETRGPIVTLSRSDAGLVRRMLELEIPEIANGVVIIKNIVREAGSRTKVAVMSRDPDVDPVGSCIGPRSSRIASIVEELRGEKVDIIRYSENINEYIAAALAPAKALSVEQTAEYTYAVTVPAEQLSLAIGKEGQNARMAARLLAIKIDILS